VTEPIPGHVDRDSVVLVFTDLTGSAHAFAFASMVEAEPFLDSYLYRPPFLTKKFRRWLSSLPDPLVFTLDGQRMTYVRSGQGVTVTGTTADQTDRFQYLLDTAAAALGLAVPVTDPVPLANHLLRQSWERTAPASWRHRARHQHARMLRQIR
jgi:hypothetical protein